VHLDYTLKLFDPALDPEDLPALQRRPRRTEWFAKGEVTQRVYEAVRDKGIIWPRKIAKAAMAAKGIPEPDKLTTRDIISRFANVVYDLMIATLPTPPLASAFAAR
jgi:hypothetical protein